MARNTLLCCILAVACTLAVASDPAPLQDFCVADPNSQVLVNGVACLDPKLVTADNFSLSGLDMPGNVLNPQGSAIMPATVGQIPGLNTLGISLVRIDYAPWGVVSLHTHPRASEILVVIEGTLLVGFVTSNPNNKLITKVLEKGDVFVFPEGLIHFQQNVGYGNAFSFSSLSSQNPGVVLVPDTVFGSTPLIATDVLAKAFQVDKAIVEQIEAKF
ncbi:putative germin-like protein 2-1 [Syzygium oleosum]|uniref:putative germin-like protein 2-1 n=1 Tax=Syzygium oleosum TaxID=219896 RepID=UPI0024B92E9D|nr:putative germin-like protein 2-1 [Syzygium oleosum]